MAKQTLIELFYSRTCPNCKPQKELFESKDFDAEVRMTNVSEQSERAKKLGVRSVPTTIVTGSGIDNPIGFTGLMTEEKVRKAVKVASGRADESILESESVFSLLKEKFKDIFKR